MSLVLPRLVSPSAKPPSVCLLDWSLCQVFFISLHCCIGESLEDNEKTVTKGEGGGGRGGGSGGGRSVDQEGVEGEKKEEKEEGEMEEEENGEDEPRWSGRRRGEEEKGRVEKEKEEESVMLIFSLVFTRGTAIKKCISL